MILFNKPIQIKINILTRITNRMNLKYKSAYIDNVTNYICNNNIDNTLPRPMAIYKQT